MVLAGHGQRSHATALDRCNMLSPWETRGGSAVQDARAGAKVRAGRGGEEGINGGRREGVR